MDVVVDESAFGGGARKADGQDGQPHCIPFWSRCRTENRITLSLATLLVRRAARAHRFLVHRPHAFEIVIGADFRTEDMNDHVAGIDQNPIALRQAVHVTSAVADFLQPPRQVLGDGGHMARRAPVGDHDRVA